MLLKRAIRILIISNVVIRILIILNGSSRSSSVNMISLLLCNSIQYTHYTHKISFRAVFLAYINMCCCYHTQYLAVLFNSNKKESYGFSLSHDIYSFIFGKFWGKTKWNKNVFTVTCKMNFYLFCKTLVGKIKFPPKSNIL